MDPFKYTEIAEIDTFSYMFTVEQTILENHHFKVS